MTNIEKEISKRAKEDLQKCAVASIPSDTLDEIPIRAKIIDEG